MQYHFNQFVLDTERFELSKADKPLAIEPQVIELIALLIKHRHRLVSKEEINQEIWQGRIVSEASLSSRIKSARQILGDDGHKQQVIRTVHKKGFRFVASVKENPIEGFVERRKTIQPTSGGRSSSISDNPSHSKPAIAVLPFSNLTNDEEQEYFSDGITTDIIAHLSKHRWLNVTARNTTFGYKGKAVDIVQLGKELKVNYVIEGTVQKAGQRVRVTASLIDANSGIQKWSDRYDRELVDIFELQDQITEMLVARLEPEIGYAEREKIRLCRPANLQAWDCYHLGIYHFFKFTGDDNLQAQRLLQQSIELDNNFGEAHVWWAYAVILGMVYWTTKPSQVLLDRALAACDSALSSDSQNALFHALKARVLLARKEYSRAITENKIAIKLNPTFAAAHCGLGDSLAYEGRYQESIDCFDKAIDLSPNDPQLWAFYTYGALALLFKRDFERALDWLEKASNIPNFQYWTIAHQVVALAYLERSAELNLAKTKLNKLFPEFSCEFAQEKLFYLKDQNQIDFYIDGLRKAGVVER